MSQTSANFFPRKSWKLIVDKWTRKSSPGTNPVNLFVKDQRLNRSWSPNQLLGSPKSSKLNFWSMTNWVTIKASLKRVLIAKNFSKLKHENRFSTCLDFQLAKIMAQNVSPWLEIQHLESHSEPEATFSKVSYQASELHDSSIVLCCGEAWSSEWTLQIGSW